jgi:hypothetical protein
VVLSPRDTFQETVVAAVYIDQSVKRQREKSIILNGPVTKVSTPDMELFTSLCTKEFQLEPQIVAVKRLGRVQAGNIQPLLVHLKHYDQAKLLISNAKKLSLSSDPVINVKVFTNSNLTRAVAAAADQVRVQRRLALQRRNESAIGVNSSDTNSCSNCAQNDLQPLKTHLHDLTFNSHPFTPATPLTGDFRLRPAFTTRKTLITRKL